MKNAIITGATSGIGRELAVQLSKKGYKVGLIGRREDRLKELKTELGDSVYYRAQDVTSHESAELAYRELIAEMGGLDLMILNAGTGRIKLLPQWESDEKIIDLNVTAFAHGMHFAFDFFREQGYGQIVGMSSMAALLTSGRASAYTASKHFISNYMAGFRQKVNRIGVDITITDIRPGYVESELTEGAKGMFWVSSTEKAVSQMVTAIEKKKNRVYVTKRWNIAALIAKLTPGFIWDRLSF